MSDNPTPKEPTHKRVTSAELCKRFNEKRYWERVLSKELKCDVIESHESLTLIDETVAIQSQIISITKQDGTELSRAHRFVRPDGSIAASGKPDPKKLFDEDTNEILRLEKKSGR